jgi:hypothetical protein
VNPRAGLNDIGSASRPCRFTPRENAAGTQFIVGWVDPRADLKDIGSASRPLQLYPWGKRRGYPFDRSSRRYGEVESLLTPPVFRS